MHPEVMAEPVLRAFCSLGGWGGTSVVVKPLCSTGSIAALETPAHLVPFQGLHHLGKSGTDRQPAAWR